MSDCPNCGNDMNEDEICNNCGFNFNDTLTCPCKVSLRCIHTEEKCEVVGLDFEDCSIYLTKNGI